MNRQISLDSEQILRTEPSMKSIGKERMIILFHSTIIQGDGHIVKEFFNFERRRINNDQSQRSSTEENQEKKGTGQEQYGCNRKEERLVSMSLFVLVVL